MVEHNAVLIDAQTFERLDDLNLEEPFIAEDGAFVFSIDAVAEQIELKVVVIIYQRTPLTFSAMVHADQVLSPSVYESLNILGSDQTSGSLLNVDFGSVARDIVREPLYLNPRCRFAVWQMLIDLQPTLTAIDGAFVNVTGL